MTTNRDVIIHYTKSTIPFLLTTRIMISLFLLIGFAATLFTVEALLPQSSSRPLFCPLSSTVFRQNNMMLRKQSMLLQASGNNNDNLSDLKIDESKLTPSEAERLKFIQKLSLEADELVRAGGIKLGDSDSSDNDMIDRAVRDTKWTGQSDMEETTLSTNNWSDVSRRPGLALGDMLALLSFAAIGRNNHGEGLDIVGIAGTAAPFILSWFLVSPFLGSFSRGATSSKGGAPVGLLGGWVVSMPLALGLRGLYKGEIPPTPFIIVSMVATLVVLSIWRVLFVSLNGGTSDKEYKSAGLFEVFKMVGTLVKRW